MSFMSIGDLGSSVCDSFGSMALREKFESFNDFLNTHQSRFQERLREDRRQRTSEPEIHEFEIPEHPTFEWIEERIVRGLLKQGTYGRGRYDEKSGMILYRSEDVWGARRRCALGFLIPDSRYRASFEGKRWENIKEAFPEYAPFVHLLVEIQRIHDLGAAKRLDFDTVIIHIRSRIVFDRRRSNHPPAEIDVSRQATSEPVFYEYRPAQMKRPYPRLPSSLAA